MTDRSQSAEEPGSGSSPPRLGYELMDLLRAEIVQLSEEGCDVSGARRELEALESSGPSGSELEAIFNSLDPLQPEADFGYDEPNDYAAILKARPETGGNRFELSNLDDRMLGAWLGRCAGCLLGKLVEGWPREDIVTYLRAGGDYPLSDYFDLLSPNPVDRPMHGSAGESTRGGIVCMPRDDDIDYTILALHGLEECGFDFTTADIAQEWITHLPYEMVYTAERVAYRNIVNRIASPRTSTYRNPYREWIGAQIRADAYGYVNPGNPERAAELAFRDAALSHVKNGIYGAMFVAVTVAAAFGTMTAAEAIRAGLAEIPSSSRLSEAITFVLGLSVTDARLGGRARGCEGALQAL